MASRSSNAYARAYSFGADGSAALAGSPIASPRPLQQQQESSKRYTRKEAGIPRWAAFLVVASVVFVMSFFLLSLMAENAQLSKDIDRLKIELARTQEDIGMLEVSIAQAGDPARVQGIAINRLGMKVAHPAQMATVYLGNTGAQADAIALPSPEPQSQGLFSLLLGLIGG